MAITENQISDIFQKQVGRAPTPYEISKYSTASIQDLTGLKNTFSSYKPDQSIVDYLAFQGQDSSTQARSKLASDYGITGYTGSYDQNTQLLKSLKTGAPKNTTPTVGGTVAGATPAVTTTSPAPDTTNPTVPGSISGAVNPTPDNSTPTNEAPEVTQSRQAYTSAQQSVLQVTAQIDEINKAIDSALQNKRDEISRSGGIVDESQLRSTVLAENAPLLAERKSLLDSRTQLVGEQNIAGKNYNDMVSQSYKNEQLKQGQEKIDQASEKMDVQQTQFTQKLEQTGWKSTKVNVYDPAGNVIGNKVVWTENPGSAPTDNKAQTTTTSSGNGGISKNGTTNVGNTTEYPKVSLADGASPAQVLQTLISGKPVYVKGSTVPVSQQDLYNLAIMDMLGSTSTVGGRTPSGAILAVKDKETQIMNAYGLTPFDVAIAKTQFKNLGSANLQLLQTASFIHTYGSTAVDNLNLALAQSDKVGRSGAKIANNFAQWMQGNFTPAGDLAQFETYIYTASREYAKVTSGGAKSAQALTDSAQSQVDKLISASQSPEVFKQVVTAMENDMNNVIANFDKQTNSFPNEIKALYGMASKAPELMRSSVTDDKTFVEKSLVRQGYNYDALMTEMKANIPQGTQPALDNETGQPVYATPDDIKSGKATPL
jgi:hypothetical protein